MQTLAHLELLILLQSFEQKPSNQQGALNFVSVVSAD